MNSSIPDTKKVYAEMRNGFKAQKACLLSFLPICVNL